MRVGTFTSQRFTLTAMNQKQASINRLQEEISSGKKLLKPSDDPAQVAATENLDAAIIRLEQYKKNSSQVEQRLQQEESVLNNLTDSLQRLKELTIAANSGTLNSNDLKAYRFEVGQIRNQLLDYANTQTATGEYLFSGAKNRTQPFSMLNGSVVYNGDQTQNQIRISDSRQVPDASTGDHIFQRILNGNGYFSIDLDSTNTGTGVIGHDSVIDPSVLTQANYRIEFSSANSFDVINSDSGATVLASQPFSADAPIRFDGIEVAISGQPAAGDAFTISPSRNEDLFSTVDRFYQALANRPQSGAERAAYHQRINQVMNGLDRALDHIGSVHSELGAKLRYIDNTRSENESVDLVLKQTRSKIEDTDLVRAISDMKNESTTLEALRQTYTRFGSRTLFDYLR